jgi:hypothetical protein
MHNPKASRAKIMGGLAAGMHKTILPLASGCTPPPNCCPKQQQLQQQHPMQGTTWQHVTPPGQLGRMPTISGNYRQRTTMAMPVYQPGQPMINFVGQNPAGAEPIPMMQMMQPVRQQMKMPMMTPYYAPYQQNF